LAACRRDVVKSSQKEDIEFKIDISIHVGIRQGLKGELNSFNNFPWRRKCDLTIEFDDEQTGGKGIKGGSKCSSI
jgi:hypothetical protein